MFELFDNLCLLCDGRCMFFGPAGRALAHYESVGLPCPPLRNPADHFLHAINADFQVASDFQVTTTQLASGAKGIAAGGAGSVSDQVAALAGRYEAGLAPAVAARAEELGVPGPLYRGGDTGGPGWGAQTAVLTKR
jgi:hypothetical protein